MLFFRLNRFIVLSVGVVYTYQDAERVSPRLKSRDWLTYKLGHSTSQRVLGAHRLSDTTMSTLLPPAGAAPIVTLPSTETVHEARKRIAPHVLRTPLVELLGPTDETALGNSHAEEDGNGDASAPLKIYLKLENLQHTGCFKARGAFNALLSCDAETCRNHGVITSSAGNFGQVRVSTVDYQCMRIIQCTTSSHVISK